jgi:hypothetical protein
MPSRPSTAPIALLLTTGIVLLALTAVIPTSTESVVYPDSVTAGQAVTSHTVTSTDPAALTIAIVLLVLAVTSFTGAGLLWRRRRAAGQR